MRKTSTIHKLSIFISLAELKHSTIKSFISFPSKSFNNFEKILLVYLLELKQFI